MEMIVLALVQDPQQARGLVRALDDAGFEREEIDTAGGMVADLSDRGVPTEDAQAYAEGAGRGCTVVCVCADDETDAERAAMLMAQYGALDIEGDYRAGAGRMYRDPRTRPSPSTRTPGAKPGGPYHGPERRVRDQPYVGINRRAV
jgi:hypothetical protein